MVRRRSTVRFHKASQSGRLEPDSDGRGVARLGGRGSMPGGRPDLAPRIGRRAECRGVLGRRLAACQHHGYGMVSQACRAGLARPPSASGARAARSPGSSRDAVPVRQGPDYPTAWQVRRLPRLHGLAPRPSRLPSRMESRWHQAALAIRNAYQITRRVCAVRIWSEQVGEVVLIDLGMVAEPVAAARWIGLLGQARIRHCGQSRRATGRRDTALRVSGTPSIRSFAPNTKPTQRVPPRKINTRATRTKR
jgi:hypothetical protein